MANIQNLRPSEYKLSQEEAKKGGINSGKARREKATMLSTLKALLDEEAKNGKTYRENVTLGLLKGAMKGNAVNYKTIIELLGEKPEGDSNAGILVELLEALNNGKKN